MDRDASVKSNDGLSLPFFAHLTLELQGIIGKNPFAL